MRKKLYTVLAALSVLVSVRCYSGAKAIQITLKLSGCKPGDTAVLAVHHYLIPGLTDSSVIYKAPYRDGLFAFLLTATDGPLYVSLARQEMLYGTNTIINILEQYYTEPGDNLVIVGSKIDSGKSVRPELKYKLQYRFKFSGEGSDKYTARYRLDSDLGVIQDVNLLDAQGTLAKSEKVEAGRLILDEYRPRMSKEAYDVLLIDMLSEVEIDRLRPFMTSGKFNLDELKSLYSDLPAKAIAFSRNYPLYLSSIYRAVFKLERNASGSGAIYFIASDYQPSVLRERLATAYVLTLHRRLVPEAIGYAEGMTGPSFYHRQLLELESSLKPGSPAFNFALSDDRDNTVRLSDYKGKLVFIDFWFTGCHACNGYYKDVLKAAEDYFQSNDQIVFITISVDKDVCKWRSSIRSGDYTSTKAINLYTGGQGAGHPVVKSFKVLSYPRPVLIDRSGRIISTQDKDLRLGGASRLIAAIENALN